MADMDPRVFEEMNRNLDYIARSLAGGRPKSTTTSTPASSIFRSLGKNTGMLSDAISKTTGTIKLMHGSLDDLLMHMRHLGREVAGMATIGLLVKSAMELGKTYSKLTDIGQTFGGSMFQMAQQAGESGLSLEEFARMLEKNSTAAAVLNEHQQGSASAMGQLQLAVRNNLKDFGFYGMTLSQLTDTTSDYAETMRMTGQLDRLGSMDQRKAITDMIGDVTAFSDATGKSREAILKGVNAAARETSAAMRMAAQPLGREAQKAYTTFTSFFASLPGVAGEELPKFFAQLYGTGGNAWFTEMGQSFIKAGMGEIPARMSRMVGEMQSGVAPVGDMVDSVIGMREDIIRHQRDLQNLANAGNQDAARTLAFGQSLLGLDREQLKRRIEIAQEEAKQKTVMEKYTASLMLFESEFHQVTGQFRTGFYKSFSEAISGFTNENGAGKKAMDKLQETLGALGTAFGTLLGKILSPENLNYIARELDHFADLITKVSDNPQFMEGLESFENAIIWLGKTIWSVAVGFNKFLQSLGLSSGGATIVEGLLIAFRRPLFSLVRSFLGQRIFAQKVVIITTETGLPFGRGGPGGPGGALSRAEKGLEGAASGVPIGRFAKGARWARGAAFRGFAGMITGMVVDGIGDALIENFAPDKVKQPLESLLNGATTGATLGFAVGGPIGALIGGAVGAIGELLIENTPSPEEIKKQLSAYVAPSLAKKDQENQQKLDSLQTDLLAAQQRSQQDKEDGDRTSMKEDMAKIAALTEQIRDLQARQTNLHKDSKDALEQLSNGSWMMNAPAGGF